MLIVIRIIKSFGLVVVSALLVNTVQANTLGLNQKDVIPNQYIVKFKDRKYDVNSFNKLTGESVRQVAERMILRVNQQQQANAANATPLVKIKLHSVYNKAIKGYLATLTKDAVTQLLSNPDIEYIEPDTLITIGAFQSPVNSFGLDRIDQRDLPLDDVYQYFRTGLGVHAYIIDTGILSSHIEFVGRVGNGYDFVDNDNIPNDCNGHGTQVAGFVGGETTGVAKDITLHPIKVFRCDGRTTVGMAISGIDWLLANHQKPAVVNMSFSKKGASAPLETAISNIEQAGLSVAVGAGNDGIDACTVSPARVSTAITVGASGLLVSPIRDTMASWSNFGSCVNILAPNGGNTASIATNDSYGGAAGTSMSVAFVTGVAALYLESNPTASPRTVFNTMISGASANKMETVYGNTPNKLLYSNYVDPIPEPVLPNYTWLIPIVVLLLS